MTIGFRLKPEEAGGNPSYFDSIMKGFKGAQEAYDTAYKPQTMAAKLLDAQLKNAHDRTINQYLGRSEEARIGSQESSANLNNANAGLVPFHKKLLEAQALQAGASAEKAKQIANLYSQVLNEPSTPSEQQDGGEISSYQPGEETPPYAGMTAPTQERPASSSNYKQALVRHLVGLPTEMPHEKMEREISTSNIQEQNKLNVKRAQQLRETAKDLQLAGLDVDGIHDILTGPDSLGTGITKTLVGKLGWGSQKLGAFNERALRLQAQMTKALSSRGGAQAANIVAAGKPSSWKSTSENLGITDAYADRLKNEFKLLDQEYKSITGKNLPYSLPEYVHNIGRKIDANIFKPKTDFVDAKAYHDYMASLKPEQRQMVIKALRESRK